MLKTLGWSGIIVGFGLCCTIIFVGFGFPMMAIGALLLIADAFQAKKRREEEQEYFDMTGRRS